MWNISLCANRYPYQPADKKNHVVVDYSVNYKYLNKKKDAGTGEDR